MSRRTKLHEFTCIDCHEELATYNWYPDSLDMCEDCRRKRGVHDFKYYEEIAEDREKWSAEQFEKQVKPLR